MKEMKWIPVSEKLPNRHHRVLCYFKYEPESPDIISENTYIGGGMWMSESDKVVAWMPLPEEYEGEQKRYMPRKNNKDGYVLKSEVQLIIQNYIHVIQMNDYGSDNGIPQLYRVMDMIEKMPIKDSF